MLILGLDDLLETTKAQHFSLKMVFNSEGAIFFPASSQHRDMKAAGISYEDNYKGNALAAMLAPNRIEVRFHSAFKDQQVARILAALLQLPALAFMATWQATYQGRPIALTGEQPDR